MDIAIKEQDDNDSAFLKSLCETYGLILKVYMGKIWIFDREKYKQKDAVRTFTPADIVPGSFSWNTTLAGTYTGGVFTYTNQRKKVNINVTVGSGDRMLKLNQYASSEADAKRQLEAAIAMKNHSNTTVSFKTMGDLNIHATQCVNIQGYGKMDGKYQLHGAARNFHWCAGGVHGIQSAYLWCNDLRHILAAQYVRLVVQRPAERRRTGRSIPGQPEDHGYNPPDQHKGMERRTNAGCYAADGRLQNPPGGIRRRHGDWREATGGHAGRKFRRHGAERRKGGGVQGKAPRLRQSKV